MRFGSHLSALLAVAFPLTLAASNPHIILNGDPPDPTILVNQNFTFGADNLGGGDFSFENQSGVNWTSLVVSATLPDLTAITCGPGPFVTCTISTTPVGNDFLYNIIFGPAATGGIPNNGLFSIDLNDSGTDPGGVGSWGPGTDFSAKANTVADPSAPEPASLALASLGMLGFAAIAVRRRRLNAGRIPS